MTILVHATPDAPAIRSFMRRIVLPLTLLVAAVIAFAAIFVLVTSHWQNAQDRSLSMRLAEAATTARQEPIARSLRDDATRPDAFDSIVPPLVFLIGTLAAVVVVLHNGGRSMRRPRRSARTTDMMAKTGGTGPSAGGRSVTARQLDDSAQTSAALPAPDADCPCDPAIDPSMGRPLQPSRSQRQDLRQAIRFAQRQDSTLNLLLTLQIAAGDAQAATEFRGRLEQWFHAQRQDGRRIGWFGVWASRPDGDGSVTHVLLHCPSKAMQARLRRAVKGWSTAVGGTVALKNLSWTLPGRGGPLRCSVPNLVMDVIARADLAPEGGVDAGWQCGSSSSLDRAARARWRAMDRMSADIRRAVAALRAASETKPLVSDHDDEVPAEAA